MAKKKPPSGAPGGGPGATYLSAADFKARCLHLMNRVRESGAEYVITKHGRPVARLVPCLPAVDRPLFGSMTGSVLTFDRPTDPIDGDYDINQ
jgi:prevent-host-death family protein